MAWQLADSELRAAIADLLQRTGRRCVLAGTVAAQVHIAAALGLEKRGPPAHRIDVVRLDDCDVPDRIGRVPVRVLDGLGMEASIEASRSDMEVEGALYPVASPEHVLGLTLAQEEIGPDGKWACFALMRALESRGLDLEEARGFVKRRDLPDREVLLHELSYLAA